MENKLVKVVKDGFFVTTLIVGIGWIGKKVFKLNFISDISASFSSFFEFNGVVMGALALKDYLTDQKIIPAKV